MGSDGDGGADGGEGREGGRQKLQLEHCLKVQNLLWYFSLQSPPQGGTSSTQKSQLAHSDLAQCAASKFRSHCELQAGSEGAGDGGGGGGGGGGCEGSGAATTLGGLKTGGPLGGLD